MSGETRKTFVPWSSDEKYSYFTAKKKNSPTDSRLPCEQGLYSVLCTVMAPEKVTSTRCACKVAEWTLGCLLFPLSLPDCLKTPHYAYIQKFHKRQENYNIFKPPSNLVVDRFLGKTLCQRISKLAKYYWVSLIKRRLLVVLSQDIALQYYISALNKKWIYSFPIDTNRNIINDVHQSWNKTWRKCKSSFRTSE